MRDDRLYLIHIAECIDRIVRYTADGKDAFFSDTRTQDAVLRNLHVLTESTQRISEELRRQHPEVAWRETARFGNVVVHQYLGIDLLRIWDIIERDLPILRRQVGAMLEEMDQN